MGFLVLFILESRIEASSASIHGILASLANTSVAKTQWQNEGGRQEGRTEGRREGRKAGRWEGREEGRQVGRKEGRQAGS